MYYYMYVCIIDNCIKSPYPDILKVLCKCIFFKLCLGGYFISLPHWLHIMHQYTVRRGISMQGRGPCYDDDFSYVMSLDLS